MANRYTVGQLVRCIGTFTDTTDEKHNPTAVSVKVVNPSGTSTTYVYGTDAALVNDSTGIYHIDISPTTEGRWWYQFAATGTGQTAEKNYFEVEAAL